MAGGRELHRRRFKELVLYASERAADHPRFGSTKLNKILFFSDFEAYLRLGRSITGAEYQKLKRGPAARMFPVLVGEMESDREIEIVRRKVIDYYEEVPVLKESRPNPSVFTEEERAIIDEVIDTLRDRDAGQTSDLSHFESAGWRVADLGETIPYETAIVSPKRPPAHAVEQLRQRVLSGNWD